MNTTTVEMSISRYNTGEYHIRITDGPSRVTILDMTLDGDTLAAMITGHGQNIKASYYSDALPLVGKKRELKAILLAGSAPIGYTKAELEPLTDMLYKAQYPDLVAEGWTLDAHNFGNWHYNVGGKGFSVTAYRYSDNAEEEVEN